MPVGTGQGSASRSIFPDVRVGRSSTTASRGTKGAGSVDRRWARAASWAKPSRTATYPTSTVPPEPVRRTAAAAPVTPGTASRALSTSPSSMRRPPSLTWSSARPTNSSPADSFRTRSPLR